MTVDIDVRAALPRDDQFRVLTVAWESEVMAVTVYVMGSMDGSFDVAIVPGGAAALGNVPRTSFNPKVDPKAVGDRIDALLALIAEGTWPAEVEPYITTYSDFLSWEVDAMADRARGFALPQEGPIQ